MNITTKEEAIAHLKELDREVGALQEEKENLKLGYETLSAKLSLAEQRLEEFQDLEKALKKVVGSNPTPAQGSGGRVSIAEVGVDVSIEHKEPEPRSYSTTGDSGKIVYLLVTDLKKAPATRQEILAAGREHGWAGLANNFPKRISELLSDGVVVADQADGETKYRVPLKVPVKVE